MDRLVMKNPTRIFIVTSPVRDCPPVLLARHDQSFHEDFSVVTSLHSTKAYFNEPSSKNKFNTVTPPTQRGLFLK